MSTEWRSAYATALHECDASKVVAACDHARRIINDRMLELGAEIKELEEGLRQLLIHQVGKSGIAPH